VIAGCPECQTRYRIAPEKVGPNGARIRCSQCSAIFRIDPPEPDIGAHVLVAEPDPELAKQITGYLECWRITTHVVEGGVEALLYLHRSKPDAAILGANLPGLRGAELAEITRRTAELADVKLVRVVPGDEPINAEYEADHTLEPGDLPDGLAPILERLELGSRPSAAPSPPPPAPSPSEPEPQVASAQPPAASGTASGTAAGTGTEADPDADAPAVRRRRRRSPPLSDDPEVAAAERLARIIVSDIILYNDEKFAQAVINGDAPAALQAELEEAGQLFTQRIPEEVRAKRDFLVEELERRAQAQRS